ncbi:MAG TPA: DUF937 domain-containing protein [Pyrinomonadaceae bacterium]|nr:DUF937 domain-containing protein [Pyrinomonadaceae bacterium]
MNAITQMISQRLAGAAAGQLASRLGVSESTAQTAVQVAVPLIVAALARNAAQPQGAQDLHDAVSRDHDGSILENLMGYLSNPEAANGGGILGHVLGAQRPAVESNLSQVTGLDQGSAGNLLQTVAPLVMGALGREQRQNGLDASGLSQFLGEQQQQAQATNPDLMQSLSSILDSNRDGSVVDDLSRIAGTFFK